MQSRKLKKNVGELWQEKFIYTELSSYREQGDEYTYF